MKDILLQLIAFSPEEALLSSKNQLFLYSSDIIFVNIDTLKDILLRCELNFTDVATVLVTAVASVFSSAKAVKTAES